MNNYTVKKSKLPFIVIIIFIILDVIAYFFSYSNQGDSFYLTIFGGITTGLLIAIAQYIVSLAEFGEIEKAYSVIHNKEEEIRNKEQEIQKFKDMGVQKVLSARDDPEAYGSIISQAQNRIWVMGNTASRLLEDFANESPSSNWYKEELLKFLKRGGEVKILVSEKRYLFKDKDKGKFATAKSELEKISENYEKFNFVYFKHIPTHSIFVFDDYCLLGPIFDDLDSKSTPALAMDTNSDYAQKYLNYFNSQWAKYLT